MVKLHKTAINDPKHGACSACSVLLCDPARSARPARPRSSGLLLLLGAQADLPLVVLARLNVSLHILAYLGADASGEHFGGASGDARLQSSREVSGCALTYRSVSTNSSS